MFSAFLIGTPIVVWLIFADKLRSAKKDVPTDLMKWPKWEMIAATVAFAAWGLGVPGNPFVSESWYNAGLAGLAVLVVSAALG